ncbi:hypothetical protein [Gemmobacter serpentinus]|uniref:hypothetical protein n=1 Tax=Gemmobacter serpentinus TaxID=2652247 RepID=UPI00124F4FC3|nr:hypothetical protein [Gemmobacter serpentinus]
MRLSSLTLFATIALATAGCVQSGGGYNNAGYGYQPQPTNPLQTQGGRALLGGVLGAAAADATDQNMVAGAALGALAGGASCGVPGLPACR